MSLLVKNVYKYKSILRERYNSTSKKGQIKSINDKKNKILTFFLEKGRWPKRKSELVRERKLGANFENYICPTSSNFDKDLRSLVMSTGRKSNNKRSHNVDGFKQEILEFVKKHGRAPTTYSGQKIKGEGALRAKLDYYTQQNNDMTLLGKVYDMDKCHRSGIPTKYRRIINENVDFKKPLIRMV